jgi:hypothetical protein
MFKLLILSFVLLVFALPTLAMQSPQRLLDVVSTGQEVDLLKHLSPERPTVFVFLKPTSTLERDFLESLRRKAGDRIGFGVVQLKSGDEPVAKQYEVKETPTALVYDRRGRLITRSSDAAAIEAAVLKAAQVMRIDWVEEGDPRFDEVVRMLGGRRQIPGILRTMSFKPEFMAHIMDLSGKAHFSDGFLKRRTKEMIATYVSALNQCKY